MYLMLGCLGFNAQVSLPAQTSCSDFNSTSNPAGNWAPSPYPNGNVNVSFGSANTLDGSQFLRLGDLSGGSWYQNSVDYQKLGQRFSGQCLYFDFYLQNDGGYGSPIHPSIRLTNGTQSITFVANITVTPGSGWVRVKAPIANSNGSVLPSNAEGAWTMPAGMTYADFNNVMNNSTALMVSPDYTVKQSEVVMYDNICIRSCNDCTADFTLQTSFNTTTNTATASLTITNPVIVSTPGNPGSTYTVNWGDGSSSPYIVSALSHTYTTPGTYNVCVTEMKGRVVVCTKCFTFCYAGNKPRAGALKMANLTSILDAEAIGKAEVKETKNYTLVPNPAKNYVNIETNLSKNELVSVKVLDMTGKVVLEKSENLKSGRQSIKLNTENLIQGAYTVEVLSGNIISSQKLLISK